MANKSKLTQPIEVPAYLKVSKVISWFVYFWTVFGIIVLGLRVFLLLFSASETARFVTFIYNTSADYLQPFRGIFPPKTVGESGYLDVAALFAIIMYLIFAWGLSSAISYIQSKIDTVNEQEKARQKKIERTRKR